MCAAARPDRPSIRTLYAASMERVDWACKGLLRPSQRTSQRLCAPARRPIPICAMIHPRQEPTGSWSHPMIIRNNASHQRTPSIMNHTDEKRVRAMRVVLADDHPVVLGGLQALLASEPGVEIVAAVPDGASALAMIRAHEPHMAVLDITMPQLTGLEGAGGRGSGRPRHSGGSPHGLGFR